MKEVLNRVETVVPESVSERIKLTLEGLPKHQKRRQAKHSIIAAGIAASIMIGIIAVNPAFAENIPVVNSVFSYFYNKNAISEGYIKYSEGVNQTVTNNGISITINDVVCDTSTLSIGYTVKSESKLVIPIRYMMDFEVNGRDLNVGWGGRGELLDDYTYIGVNEMDIARKQIPEQFKFDLKVHDETEKGGKWNFKFTVSKKEIAKSTKIFRTNTKVGFEDSDITINQVSFSPLNTTIIYTGIRKGTKVNSEGEGMMKYGNWFVFDDRGKQIRPKGSSASASDNEFSCENHFYGINDIPEYLTVIPYEHLTKYNVQRVTEDLTDQYPIKLSQGKIGSIIIRSVEFLEEETIVHFSTEGIAPLEQSNSLLLIDENGTEILSREGHNELENGNNSNDFIKKYPALDSKKKYKLGTVNYDTYINIREDLKFIITVE